MTATQDLIQSLNDNIVNPFIILLIAFAILYFLWGVAQFVIYSDSEEERSKGKRHMIWGIMGIVIMVSVFGILSLVLNSFGVDSPPGIP